MTDELIPVVDENDELISNEPISDVHTKGLLHRETFVYLINHRGVLLQQRSDNGLWDHSAAGHFPSTETYLEGAQREFREELGVTSMLLICKRSAMNVSIQSNQVRTIVDSQRSSLS